MAGPLPQLPLPLPLPLALPRLLPTVLLPLLLSTVLPAPRRAEPLQEHQGRRREPRGQQ